MEPELVRAEVDALSRALEEERWRHVAGLEPRPSLVPLFRARSSAAHRDTAARLAAAGDAALARAVARLRAERAAAEEEEAWRAAEAAASGLGPDGPVSIAAASLALRGERDRARRARLGAAVAEAFGAAAPAREAWAERRASGRAEVALLPDWEVVVEADALLAASDDAYADVLGWLARRELGLAPRPRGDLDRADLLHLLALSRWDGLFPAGMLALALRDTLAPLKLDLARIRIDEAARPAQWPGAHAVGARVSFRRQGGAADWLDLLDAAGRALAAAHGPPPHARDPAFAHALGALLAGLVLDRRWAERRLGVDRKAAPDLSRALALRQLLGLRLRAAALRVAAEVERGTSGAAWHDAHRDALSLAALAAWPRGLAARDADGDAHAAALRGAALAARLRGALVERCDDDWWRNPRAAEVLAGMLAAGAAGPAAPLPEGAGALVGAMG
jgi:hypothetical protein